MLELPIQDAIRELHRDTVGGPGEIGEVSSASLRQSRAEFTQETERKSIVASAADEVRVVVNIISRGGAVHARHNFRWRNHLRLEIA